MQFISDRESLAEQFAFQTQNESSYLLSSRASRRRIVYEEALDPAEEQIEDFKQEIEQKYQMSIANKIYTFPFSYRAIDMFDDSELTHLSGSIQISLYGNQQSTSGEKKFQVFNKKIKSDKVNNILAHIKTLKQNMLALNFYTEDSLCESNETKPTVNTSVRKSKAKQAGDKSSRIRPPYETLNSRQQSPTVKRHLQTQPYEKPLGYILKKK